MAFRELMMIEVKEILRRYAAGQSARRVARETGADRKTVGRYLAAARSLGVEPGTEVTDELAGRICAKVQLVRAKESGPDWGALEQHRPQLEGWLLCEHPLRLRKVHELLQREGVRCTYWALRRYARQELGWHRPAATVRLADPPPGQEAQVDFARMGLIPAGPEGGQRVVWALLVTLSFSRHLFVWPCFGQRTVDVVEGLEAAWRFFGGMPHTLVPDNMSAVVQQADALAPRLTHAFLDYAQHRGLLVDPARVRRPRDKARVENQVQYVREAFFRGEQFSGLEDMRERAPRWCLEVAGERTHGTTRRKPLEHYQREEQPHMKAAPTDVYDVPVYQDAKVHPDHHIQVAGGLYSMPTAYLGQVVQVRADQRLVKVYLRGQLIKTHVRVMKGQRSTDLEDYPKDKAGYAGRKVDAALAVARGHSEAVGAYAERLLQGPYPWSRMRQAYALLRLVDRFGVPRVSEVCQRALSFDVVDVTRVANMLKRAAQMEETEEQQGRLVQLPLRFARPAAAFATRRGPGKKGGES